MNMGTPVYTERKRVIWEPAWCWSFWWLAFSQRGDKSKFTSSQKLLSNQPLFLVSVTPVLGMKSLALQGVCLPGQKSLLIKRK